MSIFDPLSEDLLEENEKLKARIKELEGTVAQFDTRGLARLYQSNEKLYKENKELKEQLHMKEHIKGIAKLQSYRAGHLYYMTESGLVFPVPISDCGEATFQAEEKAILLMRYIRKHLEAKKETP